LIYFDNAATTYPKPSPVYQEVTRCLKEYCGNPGRSTHRLSIDAARKIYECRERISSLFGHPDPEDITFTYNASYALNIAIKSRIKKGDHVLISNIEHNSVLRPVHKLYTEGIITYDIYESENAPKSILSLIRPNTSMICVNHVSNICARTLPLKEIGDIAKTKKLKLICDASQSAGILDYDLSSSNVSALCAPGHKSLYGIQGVGFIINRDKHLGKTILEGGGGINSTDTEMPAFLPDRFETGTPNTPGIAALSAALKWLGEITPSEIKKHENALRTYLTEGLSVIKNSVIYGDVKESGTTLLFNISNKSANEVGEYLADNGICVRSGYHCSPLAHKALKTPPGGAVRVSFSYFNTKREIDRLLFILSKI